MSFSVKERIVRKPAPAPFAKKFSDVYQVRMATTAQTHSWGVYRLNDDHIKNKITTITNYSKRWAPVGVPGVLLIFLYWKDITLSCKTLNSFILSFF